jgi:hypothetical protein
VHSSEDVPSAPTFKEESTQVSPTKEEQAYDHQAKLVPSSQGQKEEGQVPEESNCLSPGKSLEIIYKPPLFVINCYCFYYNNESAILENNLKF